MIQNVALRWACLSIAPLLLTTGCGSESLDTVRVSGSITLDGNPVPQGTIIFAPAQDEASGHVAIGQIQPDGTYQMSTIVLGDGVVKGCYSVSIDTRGPISTEVFAARTDTPLIPTRYASPETSGLSIDINGDRNNCDFELTSASD